MSDLTESQRLSGVRNPDTCAIVDAFPSPEGWALGNLYPGYRLAYREKGREMVMITAVPGCTQIAISIKGNGFNAQARVEPDRLAATLAALLVPFA